MLPNRRPALIALGLFTILMLMAAAACAPATTPAPTTAPTVAPTEEMQEEEHAGDEHADEEHADEEHEHSEGEESVERVPNNGAVVRIVSPVDGATITGSELEVEIATENFILGEEGRHWHLYLDGKEAAMVTGNDTTQVLHGLEPGEHEIAVTLATGDHIELEDGASIHITIAE